jgi:hypothetical protein
MTEKKRVLTCAAIAAGALFLLWVWSRFAELWLPSVAFYAGLAMVVIGLAGVVLPKRWAGQRKWALVGRWVIAGVVISGVALCWPAGGALKAAGGSAEIDRVMPEYDRMERHEIVVHAGCAAARQAAEEVALTDIRGLQALMSLRAGKRVQFKPRPLLATMTSPGGGFAQLAKTEREFVAGNVGRPWQGDRPRQLQSAEEFRGFHEPGYAKIAFNLGYEPAGAGACRVTSETRILATDEGARSAFTRYWRVIYPGSALIRVLWLDAIERRLG